MAAFLILPEVSGLILRRTNGRNGICHRLVAILPPKYINPPYQQRNNQYSNQQHNKQYSEQQHNNQYSNQQHHNIGAAAKLLSAAILLPK